MGLTRVVGEHGHAGALADHGSWVVQDVEPEGIGADGDDQVVRRERLAHLAPAPRQVPGEQRMVLREPRRPRERLLPHRAAKTLGEPGHSLPGLAVVAAAHHERRRSGTVDHLRQLAELAGGRHSAAQRAIRPTGGELVGGLGPVAHGDDHQRRTLGRHGLVVGAGDRAGHVLRTDGQLRPHRILAGEPLQGSPREEGLVGELAAILLSHEHDQRRMHVAGVGDGVDGIAQARSGVQVDQRRLPARQGEAGGHPHHGALVEAQDEMDVGRESGEERDLGRTGVPEDGGHPEPSHHVEDRVAHRFDRGDRLISIICCGHGGALRLLDHAFGSLPGANAITYALRTIGHSAYVGPLGRGSADDVLREGQGESLCR